MQEFTFNSEFFNIIFIIIDRLSRLMDSYKILELSMKSYNSLAFSLFILPIESKPLFLSQAKLCLINTKQKVEY